MIRPFDFSWLPGLPMQAKQWFQELYDNFRALPAVTTQNVVTASRALGTVYQNTTGRPMFVAVTNSALTANNVTMRVFSDSSDPPTTETARGSVAEYNVSHGFVGFWVLPGNYYMVWCSTASGVSIWTEWY